MSHENILRKRYPNGAVFIRGGVQPYARSSSSKCKCGRPRFRSSGDLVVVRENNDLVYSGCVDCVIELLEKALGNTQSNACICSSATLMAKGCKCGGN